MKKYSIKELIDKIEHIELELKKAKETYDGLPVDTFLSRLLYESIVDNLYKSRKKYYDELESRGDCVNFNHAEFSDCCNNCKHFTEWHNVNYCENKGYGRFDVRQK